MATIFDNLYGASLLVDLKASILRMLDKSLGMLMVLMESGL
jgi:hypothetical protein